MIIVAASRLVYAIARDDTLPQGKWISHIAPNKRPINAVTVVFVFGAILVCTIIPSTVAFTSIVSASNSPIVASYAVIAVSRLVATPDKFLDSSFRLWKFPGRKVFYAAAAIFNSLAFVVSPERSGTGVMFLRCL